jgi:hypothetical protein
MRAQVKAVIGLAVVAAALGAFFSVHAMTGGADSTKERVEATGTPQPSDAQAPAAARLCAAREPNCAEITVVRDSELSCEEATACAPSGGPSIECDPKLACSNASDGGAHCGPGLAIEACYPAVQPAGPYACGGAPTDVTPVVCKPPLCVYPDGTSGLPEPSDPPPEGSSTCKPYECSQTPVDGAAATCEPSPVCPTPGHAPEEVQPQLQCAPPANGSPPNCAVSSDGQVACPIASPPSAGGVSIAPSGSGVAEGATAISGSSSP